jgi:hypothetical protein
VLARVVGIGVHPRLDPLVVVVDRNRERLLRLLLADDVGVEELEDLLRLRQLVEADLAALAELFLDDLIAEIDALVADVDTGPGDQLLDLLLALPAERTLEEVASVTNACHARSSFVSAGASAHPASGFNVSTVPRATPEWRVDTRSDLVRPERGGPCGTPAPRR